MKEYGPRDEDTTAYDVLTRHIEANQLEVNYIMHYARMPIDARPCQLPLSLLVVAVLSDGSILRCRQARPGAPARIDS